MNYFLKQKLPVLNGNLIKIYLNESEIHIGRKKRLGLQNFEEVSKKHATIYKTPIGTFLIKDLNSLNGLYINGHKVGTSPQPVVVGDTIGFGNPCLDGADGFVCVLCARSTSAPELIDITEDNDEHKFLSQSGDYSNFGIQTALNKNHSTCPEPICFDLDDDAQNFTSYNKLDEIEALEVSDPSSSKSCSSCSNSVNKVDLSERNFKILNKDNTSTTLQNFLNVQREIPSERMLTKDSHVCLVKCDSDYFECPPDVQNPFQEQKLEEFHSETSPLLKNKRLFARDLGSYSELLCESPPLGIKKKPTRRLSSDSSDSNQEIESSGLMHKEYLQAPLNNDNFQNVRNEINGNGVTHFVGKSKKIAEKCERYPENVYKSVEYKDASYSQNEEIIIISDYESYFDFNSSQHHIHIKQEPPDIEEDIDSEYDIFDDSDCLQSIVEVDNFMHNEDSNVETIEAITEYVEKSFKTPEVDVSAKYDVELQHNEMANSSNNFESSNSSKFDLNKQESANEVNIDLDLQCSEGSDSDNNESGVLCSTTFPVGSNLIENSSDKCETQKVKNTNFCSSLESTVRKEKSLTKSSGRTLLTDPKPMLLRPQKIRGREEGFKEQIKYHKQTQSNLIKKRKGKDLSSKYEIISGKMSSRQKNVKIPKLKAQNNKIHTDVNTSLSFKDTSDRISLGSRVVARKKVPPLTIRLNECGAAVVSMPSKNNTKRANINNQMLQKEQKLNKRGSFAQKQNNKNKNFHRTSTLQHRLNHKMSKDKSDAIGHVSCNAAFALNTRDSSAFTLLKGLDVDKINSRQSSKSYANVPSVKTIYELQNPVKENFVKRANPVSDSNTQMNTEIIINKLINLESKWLQEQATISFPPHQVSDGAADLPLRFKSDSYVSLFAPMIMLNIWDYMYTESKEVYIGDKVLNKFFFSVISCHRGTDCYELRCESIVADKVSYSPKEGSLVVLRLRQNPNIYHSVFGYIFKHKTDKLKSSFVQSPIWQNFPEEWLVDAKYWTFQVRIKQKVMPFMMGKLTTANGICYLRSKLRLADVLGDIQINSPLMLDIMLPTASTFYVDYAVASSTREYSTSQMQLINGMHAEIDKQNSESKIILVHGPPGTGKTHTVIGLLEKLVRCSKSIKKILVVAPSNSAVDEIGCRLIELNEQSGWRGGQLNFVRVGMEKHVHEKMIPYLLEKKVKELHESILQNKLVELQNLQTQISRFDKTALNYLPKELLKLRREEYNILKKQTIMNKLDTYTKISLQEKILKHSHIVLSTINSSRLQKLRKNSDLQFSCCIVDESTLCTELEILQPLLFGMDKLILVGDLKQWPVSVTSKLAVEHGFRRSMFERFYLFFEEFHKTAKRAVFALSEQFRMHSDISKFPARYFYNNNLFTNHDIDLRYNLFPLKPYIMLHILNDQEFVRVLIVLRICKYLLDVLDSASLIGIITPCLAQRQLYARELYKDSNCKDIEINTVDGFRGCEKEVIIIPCFRSDNQSSDTGFFECRNQFNVAITRAKKCLIICCVSAVFQYPEWKSLFEDASHRNVCFPVSFPNDLPFVFEKYIKK